MCSLVDNIFSDSEKFNGCLQSDYGLSKHVRDQVTSLFSQGGAPVMCDILFLEATDSHSAGEDEPDVRQALVGYDPGQGPISSARAGQETILRQVGLE